MFGIGAVVEGQGNFRGITGKARQRRGKGAQSHIEGPPNEERDNGKDRRDEGKAGGLATRKTR